MFIIKPCGCSFCNDLRNIQPAKYIDISYKDVDGEDELVNILNKIKEEKRFVMLADSGLCVIDKCPVCGYVFDEEDYDSYD